MDMQNSYGTPLYAAGVVLAALGILVVLNFVFKGSVHF